MLNVTLGNGSSSSGICCVSIGDGASTRGAFQVNVTPNLSFPTESTVEQFDQLIAALKDVCLTYQALVDQKFAPATFAVRAKAAIDIAIDACSRRRDELNAAAAAQPAPTTAAQVVSAPVSVAPSAPLVPSGSTTAASDYKQVD